MVLVLVGDCSTPLSFTNGDPYPVDMFAVAGYLGGDTPHIWTDREIAAVRATGRQWWPIWTAPNSKSGTAISAAVGTYDGKQMVVALRTRGIASGTPVFYDVEDSTYNADPAGAQAAISAFKREVYAGGFPNVFAYCTLRFNRDWVAHWTNVRPQSLPPDWVGQQYSGMPGLDLSIFDLDKLGVELDMQVDLSDATIQKIVEDTRAAVSGTFQAFIRAELGGSEQRLVTLLGLEQQEAADVTAIKTRLSTFGTPDSSMTPDQEHAFAVELAKVFGTTLSTAT